MAVDLSSLRSQARFPRLMWWPPGAGGNTPRASTSKIQPLCSAAHEISSCDPGPRTCVEAVQTHLPRFFVWTLVQT